MIPRTFSSKSNQQSVPPLRSPPSLLNNDFTRAHSTLPPKCRVKDVMVDTYCRRHPSTHVAGPPYCRKQLTHQQMTSQDSNFHVVLCKIIIIIIIIIITMMIIIKNINRKLGERAILLHHYHHRHHHYFFATPFKK